VPNQLYTVKSGSHGGFGSEQELENFKVIQASLEEHGIV
jgi:hypothetical protein